jgi:hypothetical protein
MDADELIRPETYARIVGDPGAVHVGLRDRVERLGFPEGYELALDPQVVDRVSDLAAIYGLRVIGRLRYGAGERVQPVEWSKLDAKFMVRGLRWLPKVTADPVLLDAAERLAAIAEACVSSVSRTERLVAHYVT